MDSEMSLPFIVLRNTISGVAESYPPKQAENILADPKLGKINVIVESEKPEVLSPPYYVEDGERVFIEDEPELEETE